MSAEAPGSSGSKKKVGLLFLLALVTIIVSFMNLLFWAVVCIFFLSQKLNKKEKEEAQKLQDELDEKLRLEAEEAARVQLLNSRGTGLFEFADGSRYQGGWQIDANGAKKRHGFGKVSKPNNSSDRWLNLWKSHSCFVRWNMS